MPPLRHFFFDDMTLMPLPLLMRHYAAIFHAFRFSSLPPAMLLTRMLLPCLDYAFTFAATAAAAAVATPLPPYCHAIRFTRYAIRLCRAATILSY